MIVKGSPSGREPESWNAAFRAAAEDRFEDFYTSGKEPKLEAELAAVTLLKGPEFFSEAQKDVLIADLRRAGSRGLSVSLAAVVESMKRRRNPGDLNNFVEFLLPEYSGLFAAKSDDPNVRFVCEAAERAYPELKEKLYSILRFAPNKEPGYYRAYAAEKELSKKETGGEPSI